MSYLTSFTRWPAPEHLPETARSPTAAAAQRSEATGTDPRQPARRFGRRVRSAVATVVACSVVGFALLSPQTYGELRPAAFGRIPVEGLLGTAVAVRLSDRGRRITATVAGVVVGLLLILKGLFLGFTAVLGRPFDLVLDWALLAGAKDYLRLSTGQVGATAAVVGAAALTCAVPLLSMWSARRLSEIVARHAAAASRSVAVLGIAWVGCFVLGVHVVAGEPVAARTTVQLISDAASGARSSWSDRAAFLSQEARDPFRATPPDRLLTGLRGKDVVIAFVESYGRTAVEDPRIAPGVTAVLDAGDARLKAAGFRSSSGWLSSPTVGGGSWLAHSTLLSGLKVANQQRYRTVVTSSRLTLTSAFRKAGWRTVALMPATHGAWPEGAFYDYRKVYVSDDLGYRGPHFSWAPMTDQYALAALQRRELGVAGRPPVMVEAELISSHAPWAPLPTMVSWTDLGDGSLLGPMARAGKRPDEVWPYPDRIRTEYGHSIEYSLSALLSFVETYGSDDTVLVFLGDHQPAPVVTGPGASHDVPVTIVAKDPDVLSRVASWGWQQGLKPSPGGPTWPMEAFRDRFLTAFGPSSG